MEQLKLKRVIENKDLLELFNDPIYIIDRNKRLLYYNYHYMNLTGLSLRQLKTKQTCFECFSLNICNDQCVLEQCREIEQPIQLREVEAEDRDGNKLSFWISAFPLFGEGNQFEGALVILRDMTVEAGIQDKYKSLYGREKETKVRLEETVKERTEQLRTANVQLKIINKKLEKLSIKDDLTNLYNYRYFSEKIDELFQKAQRDNRPISCLLIDVDNFKSVNDNHSHQFGDFVLYKLGVFFSGVLRKDDILARYGGDEFVALLSDTNYNQAISLAQEMNTRVRNEIFSDGEFSTKITVSAGLSSYPADDVKVKDELVKFADRALYNAKKSGRDTFSCYKDIKQQESYSQ